MKIAKQEVALVDWMGSDLSVVNAARVSFHKQSSWEESKRERWFSDDTAEIKYVNKLSDKDAKLINYLARHNHWTVFGHCSLSFRVKAPIFVARQLGKHQVGLVWNEVSRRYVDDEPEFFFPDQWRSRPEGSVKQGSGAVLDQHQLKNAENWAKACAVDALFTYNGLLNFGVAPEQARMILPQNMMTEWIWTGSLAAFARVCKLRLDPHAQAESREVAEKIAEHCRDKFPVSFEALM